jgi:hypothetical protein
VTRSTRRDRTWWRLSRACDRAPYPASVEDSSMNDPVHWDGHERQVRRILHPGDGSWYGGHAWRISIRPGQATVAPSATCGCTRGRGQVTCGWRIRSMTQLACAVQSCAGRRSWYRSPHARTAHPCYPPSRHLREAATPRWRTCRRRRIVAPQASACDQ